ncbi:synaptosomal-associated protein 47 isoform X2 [Cavia porcellus]|uniref:synaptosomal-associated protein 47 isoform X2 n=1 Tax=Cavia porcellus TaxID=10141 RepID=UPI002FE2E4A2
MSGDVCIHSWSCSYYLDLEKRWVPGRLALMPCTLKFTADGVGAVLVSLHLSSIVAIKKEASHFIFSAITILEQGHHKYWFSSLRPSRNAVFNVMEHFWRELLLSQQGAVAEATSPALSRGQELTRLMAHSQRRLEDTARVLYHQGEKLEGVMKGLEKMESDLDVADRLLTELESPSWWPFSSKLWKTPEEVKPREAMPMADGEPCGKEEVMIQVPAVISRGEEAPVQPGGLTVLVSTLEIQDSHNALLHRFRRADVDSVEVRSPYEVSIRQRFIGKPDVVYRVLSARMPEVIPILEVQFSEKVELPGDADTEGLGSSEAASQVAGTRPVWPTDPEQAERAGPGHQGRAGETGRGFGGHHCCCGARHPDHRQAQPAHEAADLGELEHSAAPALTPVACSRAPTISCICIAPCSLALEKDLSPREALPMSPASSSGGPSLSLGITSPVLIQGSQQHHPTSPWSRDACHPSRKHRVGCCPGPQEWRRRRAGLAALRWSGSQI